MGNRRRFAVAAAALALSVALTVPAYAGTWKYVNDQWKYQKGTNKFAYNEWIKIMENIIILVMTVL